MIEDLEYFHGLGRQPKSPRPSKPQVAVSVGPSLISGAIETSFRKERIAELEGQFGDPEAGDPIEVDYLSIRTSKGTSETVVLNRGIALLLGDDDRIR
jgi:hypothetical protein